MRYPAFLYCFPLNYGVFAKAILLGIIMLLLSASVSAQGLTITVVDQDNNPLADAVVEIVSSEAKAFQQTDVKHVAQESLVFVPFVTAVQQGSLIDFPNRDKTRHHVYSFSDAKTFEIQLYTGKPEEPILFDKPGIVTLGCNIHDYMLAYIYVGESALVQVSDSAGNVHFPTMPQAPLTLKLWHPWQVDTLAEQPLAAPLQHELKVTLPITTGQEKPTAPKRGFGR